MVKSLAVHVLSFALMHLAIACAGEVTPEKIRRTVEGGLCIVQQVAQNHPENRNCFPCDHQHLPMLATCEASDACLEIDEDISPLIKQLDHDEFKQREAAEKKLTELGEMAIPALAETTKSKSPEASMRAFDIIVHHYKGGNDEVQKTAAKALQKIMESGKAFAARAKQVIEPTKPALRGEQQFKLQVDGNAGIQRRVTVSIQNGVKQVDAQEGGRHVKILDDPEKGIKVEVTEEKEGKKEIKKYKAGNVGELKANHPEAHRLYQKYVGNVRANGGNIRIRLKSDAP
jgi:hypothetical protein